MSVLSTPPLSPTQAGAALSAAPAVATSGAAADNAMLGAALAVLDAGLVVLDRQGLLLSLDAMACRMLGATVGGLQGQLLAPLLGLPDGTGLPADGTHCRFINARGEAVSLSLHAVAGLGTDDGPVTLILRDQRLHDEATLQAQALAAIVESSFDAVVGKNLDGTVTSWNAAAESLFGWRRDEMLGASVLRLIPDDRHAEELRILATIGRGERVTPFDTVRRRRDGTLVEVSVTVSPIRDRDGRIVGASKVARDIGPQRRLERLEQENREVHRAAQMKSRFLASMSHELRTPLNAVIGFADLLRGGSVPPDSPKHARFLGHIASSGRHLLQLINDVLDLSKVEAGKLVFAPEPLSPQELVRHVIELMQPEARRRGVQLQLVPEVLRDDAPAQVMLDAARLKQVLFNLLSNALKFTPGGGRVSVHLCGDVPGWWRLEVHDTGVGIAEADLPRLFVEFQQIEGQQGRAHEGTGLGLALTRRIVEAQGGQVGVRSRLGAGSVFHVRLPCDTRGIGDTAVDGASAPLRLMAVEPDLATRTELHRVLGPQGWQVQGAANAATARALWRGDPVHAMTLGLALPDEPALSLLSDLRGGPPHWPTQGSVPVLGVSLPAEEGRGAALLGVADVLFKPLRPGELAGLTTRLRGLVPQARRVLVVDDDPLAQELLRTELEAAGLQVQAALDGNEALACLREGRADAMVLDLMLPGIDGFTLLDALQSLPLARDLPVFVWTAALLSEAEHALLARSATAIVAKGGGTVTSWAAQLRRVLAQRLPAAAARAQQADATPAPPR
ncbi:ATP-binding protein [Ideonella sp. DXS22W]|uniref:histidine kinase n=1 Tax=Pseudaquabacterium inlustre TaxID=2984192 RepID=A0ABU9CMI6_9BURK